MGKLDGKVAVITGATSGMALAGAPRLILFDETYRWTGDLDLVRELRNQDQIGRTEDLQLGWRGKLRLGAATRSLGAGSRAPSGRSRASATCPTRSAIPRSSRNCSRGSGSPSCCLPPATPARPSA